MFSLISRNIAGQTKKSTTLALTFVFWAAGNMAAPQIFQKSDAPRYRKGFTAHFCLYALFNIFLVVMRILLVRRNKAKENTVAEITPVDQDTSATEQDGDGKPTGEVSHSNAFADMTDKENPAFRYEM